MPQVPGWSEQSDPPGCPYPSTTEKTPDSLISQNIFEYQDYIEQSE